MAHRLDEGTVQQLEKALNERFGDPLTSVIREAPVAGPLTCDKCGFMAEDDGLTCQNCGAMPSSMDETAPPGREKQVKALKRKKDVDNPFAVAWASYNKSH